MSYLSYGGHYGGLTITWLKMPLRQMIQKFMIFKKTFSSVKKKKSLFCKYTENNFETSSEKKSIVENCKLYF